MYSGSEKRPDKLILNECAKKMLNTTGFTTAIESENNEMLVIMEAPGEYTSKGFSADFETVNLYFLLFSCYSLINVINSLVAAEL